MSQESDMVTTFEECEVRNKFLIVGSVKDSGKVIHVNVATKVAYGVPDSYRVGYEVRARVYLCHVLRRNSKVFETYVDICTTIYDDYGFAKMGFEKTFVGKFRTRKEAVEMSVSSCVSIEMGNCPNLYDHGGWFVVTGINESTNIICENVK